MNKPLILVVEDEAIIAADIQDRLEDAGYRVIHTARGEQAVTLAKREKPGLVLMDVNLAGEMDGITAAQRICATGEPPLIFLTSNSDRPTFTRARAVGPRAFLTKPFRGRDLLNAVELNLGQGPTTSPQSERGNPQGSDASFTDRIFVPSKERMVRLFIADILFVTADDYYCRVITEDQEYLVTQTLKKFAATLPAAAPFLRVHRSYLVNLRRVTEIGEIYVYLDTHKVPISRTKRDELKRRLG